MSFDKAVEMVLREEGGLVNDPKDPGGLTNFGISKRQFPDVDVARLTRDGAIAIYRANYWNVCKCDELPWPLSLFVFDSAVNQGADAAIKMLQRALGVAQDGIVGVGTLKAAKLAPAAAQFISAKFMAYRAMRYQGTRNFDRFGEGWLTRIFRVAMESGK